MSERPMSTWRDVAPGAAGQVRALLRLRLDGLRGPARARTLIGLAGLPMLLAGAVVVGATMLPEPGRQDALLLMPTAWLAFALTSVVAAASTGARTLLPRDQSMVFPISPLAEHLGTLALAPLNAAWLFQAFGLFTLTGWGFSWSRSIGSGTIMTVLWVLACTAVAQVIGWAIELSRTTTSGPWLVRAAGLGLASGVAALVVTGTLGAALDTAPTSWFVAAAANARFWENLGTGLLHGFSTGTSQTLAGLLAVSLLSVAAGAGLVGVLQRRVPRDQVRIEARRYPARPVPPGVLALCVRIDRASVWRSVPLRRGLITLAAIPGGAAALAGLDWDLLVLLPGLAASGAGLLFGVNALALDASGSVWRESLPGRPRTWLTARLIVVTEVCLVAGAEAAVIGALRAPGWPTLAETLSVAGALLTSTALVAGRCARWSLAHPYAATLRDARDHPAPPAAMAAYSARLAFLTTFVGLAFSVCAQSGRPLLAILLTLGGSLWGLRHVVSALRQWDDAAVRSKVVAFVGG